MFVLDEFIAECREAGAETESRRAIREVLERALAQPGEVADALRPTEGGLDLLLHTPELTVLHVVWAPGMRLYPHDHRMWAAIGIYAGREDNQFFRVDEVDTAQGGRVGSGGGFFRRSGEGPESRTLSESGGKVVTEGDVLLLGDDTIHAVANPTRRLTGAIHIYGGDFVNQPRSQWGPGPAEERPYDLDVARQQFAEANAAWHSRDAGD